MIDQQWLNSLKFKCKFGQVTHCLGMGSSKVVFHCIKQDGSEEALKTYTNLIAFHIQEIPPIFEPEISYDYNSINKKLFDMVGHPRFDQMSYYYDRLHSLIIKMISENGIAGVLTSLWTPDSVTALPFILNSPGIKFRLRDIAETPLELIYATVNSSNWPVSGSPKKLRKWSKEALENLPHYEVETSPETLINNPLYIWGSAVLEGFFPGESLSIASQYITKKFGSLAQRRDALQTLEQFDAIASLLCQYELGAPIDRLVELGSLCGIGTQIVDKKGKIIASGI